MKIQRFLAVLTAANFVLLAFLLAQLGTVQANTDSSVLRGRALEIVDERGKVRLITSQGAPHVKLAAKEDGAGIVLGGDVNPAYAALGTDGGEPKLRLVNKDKDAGDHAVG